MFTQLVIVLVVLSACTALVVRQIRRSQFERKLGAWRVNWTMEGYLAQRAASHDLAVAEKHAEQSSADGYRFIDSPQILSRLAIAE